MRCGLERRLELWSAAARCGHTKPFYRRIVIRRNAIREFRNAFPCDEGPHYLLRDRDYAFPGLVETVAAMEIQEGLTAPQSPWQNAYVERLGKHRVHSWSRNRCGDDLFHGRHVEHDCTSIEMTRDSIGV